MDEIIKTITVSAKTRVYYIDLRTNSKGRQYISISEIPKIKSPGEKKRHRVFIHTEILPAFLESFQEMAEALLTDGKNETDDVNVSKC